MTKPKKGIKKKRVRLSHVLNLIFGCYENKITADQADDAVMRAAKSFVTQRQAMPDFVYDFLLNKFGLARYGTVHACVSVWRGVAAFDCPSCATKHQDWDRLASC